MAPKPFRVQDGSEAEQIQLRSLPAGGKQDSEDGVLTADDAHSGHVTRRHIRPLSLRKLGPTIY